MEHIINPEPISEYSERFTSAESAVLKELNIKTQKEIPGAQMISGHLQGAFLQMISRMIQPENVLELGTYTGYSAICLAQGLKEGGKVHTIDVDAKLQNIRDTYWEKAGLNNKIQQHIGAAAEIIPVIDRTFDLVFIDADKRNYGLYFDLIFDKMPSGGWLLVDNVLFHGEVVLPHEQQSNAAKFIHFFNEKIASDNRVEQVLLPIRDGLMLIRKK
jgi:predicted O-methyltransferase YrrM